MNDLTILGLTLKCTCEACPEQYNVYDGDTQVAYFRLRHGTFRVDAPHAGAKTIFVCNSIIGNGRFDDSERPMFLTTACQTVRAWMATREADRDLFGCVHFAGHQQSPPIGPNCSIHCCHPFFCTAFITWPRIETAGRTREEIARDIADWFNASSVRPGFSAFIHAALLALAMHFVWACSAPSASRRESRPVDQ